MSHELKEGAPLKGVFWADGDITVGEGRCTGIVVSEQPGQMSMVPWAKATFEGGVVRLYNLAVAEGVILQ